MAGGQYHAEGAVGQRLRLDGGRDGRWVGDVADAEIGKAAPHVLRHRAQHAFAQLQVDADVACAVSRDDARQQPVGDRHEGSDDQPAALARAERAHVLDADVEIGDQALRDRHEFPPGGGERDAPGAARE